MWWGPWAGPTWFWWLFPVVGFAVCFLFVAAMIRGMRGGCFMCMGRREQEPAETSELRREVRELRAELNRIKIVR